jgi:hypothetical protein
MQKAPDCDMVLIHDDDLEKLDGIGKDSVSGDLIAGHIVHRI